MRKKNRVPKLYNNGGQFFKKAGQFLENYGKGVADTALTTLGASNVIQDSAYSGVGSKFAKNTSSTLGNIGAKVLPTAMNLALPGSGAFVSAGQQAIGQFNPQVEKQLDEYGNPIQPLMAHGGIHNGQANAELERQEVMQMPDGTTEQTNGQSHEQGGVNVNIPDGTKIFSDRLKHPLTKKTFAKEAEKFKTNKEEKILKNPDINSLAKKTAQMMMAVKNQQLDKLFNEQEGLKIKQLEKYATKIGLSKNNKFWSGGIKSNFPVEYDDQGRLVGEAEYDQKQNEYNFQQDVNNNLNEVPREGSILRSNTGPLPEFIPPTNNFLNPPNISQEPVRSQGAINLANEMSRSPRQPFNLNNQQRDALSIGAGTLVNSIGELAYLKEQGKRYDKQKFHEYNPERLNARVPLQQADVQNRILNQNVANASGGNAGSYLSNRIASGNQNTMNKAVIQQKYDEANASIGNQGQQINLQNRYMVDDINAANKGKALGNYYSTLSSLGAKGATGINDYRHTQGNRERVSLLPYMYDVYENNPKYKELIKKYGR